jgi:hypothetical protein
VVKMLETDLGIERRYIDGIQLAPKEAKKKK